jgi:hypothetical protein
LKAQLISIGSGILVKMSLPPGRGRIDIGPLSGALDFTVANSKEGKSLT